MRCSCDRYESEGIHGAGCDFYTAPCPNCKQTMVRGRGAIPGAGIISMWLCDCDKDDLANLGGEYSKIKTYLKQIRAGRQTMMGLSLGELAGVGLSG